MYETLDILLCNEKFAIAHIVNAFLWIMERLPLYVQLENANNSLPSATKQPENVHVTHKHKPKIIPTRFSV